MKRKETGLLLAGFLALGLAACSSTAGSRNDTASTETVTRTEAGSVDSSMASTTGIDSATGQEAQAPLPKASSGAPNSRVTLIETVPRSSINSTSPDATVGGTGGSTGSSGDRLYRVTVVMDDGTSRVIQQEWAPSFRAGDRVRVESGAIQR